MGRKRKQNYGVPDDQWAGMTQSEKNKAKYRYKLLMNPKPTQESKLAAAQEAFEELVFSQLIPEAIGDNEALYSMAIKYLSAPTTDLWEVCSDRLKPRRILNMIDQRSVKRKKRVYDPEIESSANGDLPWADFLEQLEEREMQKYLDSLEVPLDYEPPDMDTWVVPGAEFLFGGKVIEPTPTTKEKTMAAHNQFAYVKGTGKGSKGEYKFGKVSIPASVISRIEKEIENESNSKKAMIFYSRLEKKYSSFLKALDDSQLDYIEAIRMMAEIKPAKASTATSRASKAVLTGQIISKSICKRFKGTPEEMLANFLKTVAEEEFKKEVLDTLKGYQKVFGLTKTGMTKTSSRKGNPAAIKALAKSRAAKKK